MRSIAIEREFGSGGREIGRKAAGMLDMPFYDGELLLSTAERSGLDVGQLRNFDERQAGSLLFELALATNPNPYSARTHLYEMFEALQGTIRQLAQKAAVGVHRPLLHRGAFGGKRSPGAAGVHLRIRPGPALPQCHGDGEGERAGSPLSDAPPR